ELRRAASPAGERVAATAAVGAAGARRDVTSRCVFASSDERVLTVDAQGELSRLGPGEAFVLARCGRAAAQLRIVQPFAPAAADVAAAAAAAPHPLDRAWLGWLGELGLRPAPRAAPERLVRRLYLDLLERPPTPAEVRAFAALPADSACAATAAR